MLRQTAQKGSCPGSRKGVRLSAEPRDELPRSPPAPAGPDTHSAAEARGGSRGPRPPASDRPAGQTPSQMPGRDAGRGATAGGEWSADESGGGDDGAPQEAPLLILVVDDSRSQRQILTALLRRRGYEVLEAASGEEALAICERAPVDVVLSDWMMPGMSGLDFCRAFRALAREGYGYFILLTSKSEKAEVALGLEAGADDFLTKPVNSGELHARILAGQRILRMERELSRNNRLLNATLAEMRSLYDALDRDMAEARKLQQSLMRERFRSFGTAEISLLLRPSGHVGGDLVGFFPIGKDRVGFFSIDVAGHGVTSALMTARLSSLLSGSSTEQNIVLRRDMEGALAARRADGSGCELTERAA